MKAILTLLMAALFVGSLSAQSPEGTQLADSYLAVKNALVDGDASRAATASGPLSTAITGLAADDKTKAELLKQVSAISKSADLEKQRQALAQLSVQLWPILKTQAGATTLYYAYCPMKKAYWISDQPEIRNPFFGKQMLSCGKVESTTKQ